VTLLHGVGARLSLALALVVAAALGVVYLIVVPSLEERLVDARRDEVRALLPTVLSGLPADPFRWEDYAGTTSFRTGARIVIYDVDSVSPTAVRVVADSRGETSQDVSNDPHVIEAAESLGVASGTVTKDDGRFAEAATAFGGQQHVLLVQRPLADSVGAIDLVERRLVLAGAIALVGAVGVGLAGAAVFARRIRRLERAAGRIARGAFDEPIVDTGSDELGQLAVAFERMRGRLLGLDNARREFIANASHELRTPIFALSGALELLAEEEMDDATRDEFVDTMREQTARLAKLADELLDLSRLDAGRLHLDPAPIDLIDVAHDVVLELGPAAQLSGHHLAVGGGASARALGDDARVHQIARGLVDNALRHTPAGSSVVVEAGVDGENAWLAVADDGPGIPADHQARIFERFYRVDDGARASGSGLGLAIAGELAAAMGGAVELQGDAPGARFVLRLPRVST
jgi:signal transduction histidine kinase